MKTHFALITTFLFFTQNLVAQCTYCTDLEEALKAPLKVETLDLRAKGLREVPSEINKFSNLQELNLSDNFIFEIDYTKIQLSKLEKLSIKNNPGFYTVEMEGIANAFPNLIQLNLHGNGIKFLSAELAQLKKLEHLNLSNNSISILPEEIEQMTNLTYLNLSDNNLLAQSNLFSGLWKLKELNIANNDSLKNGNLFKSLLFKNELTKISLTAANRTFFTKEFNELSVETIEFVNSTELELPSVLRTNKSLKTIVFDNCTFIDPSMAYSVLNEIDSIEMVVFRNMKVPTGISSLKSLKEIHLNNVQNVDPKDLSKISPKTSLLQNNVSFKDELTNTTGEKSSFKVSLEMLENDSPCIKDVKAKTVVHISSDTATIRLENTTFNIPTNAFLNKDGSLYAGEVTISAKEYMDPIINALAGMPMMMNENGTSQLFSSNGMIEFKAVDNNNNELLPNPDQIIQVEITDLQPSEESDLFVFDKTQNNWNRIGQPTSTNLDSTLQARIDAINKLTNNELVSTRKVYPLVSMKIKRKAYDPYQLAITVQAADKFETSNAPKSYFFPKAEAMQQIGDQSWEIDTIPTDELKNLFYALNKSQKKLFKYKKTGNRKKITTSGVPRIITDLKITPDLESDNYRLTFNFKGNEIDLPVYQSLDKSPSRIQKEEAKFYLEYTLKQKKDLENEALLEKRKEQYIKKEAPKIRVAMINAARLGSAIVLQNEEPDKLRFGLTSFGTVNCDYFSRSIPEDYLALSEFSKDQDGLQVKIPPTVQNVLSTNNVYLTTYSQTIPFYANQKNYILFSINENEIAVIKSPSKLKISDKGVIETILDVPCTRINITNLQPEEIRKQILNI